MIKKTTVLHNDEEDTCGIAQNKLWRGGEGPERRRKRSKREKAKEQ